MYPQRRIAEIKETRNSDAVRKKNVAKAVVL